MEIKTDTEGKQILLQICDAALKYGGVQIFNSVGRAIRELEKNRESDKKPEREDN